MQLEHALAQLSAIHSQILRSEVFRGYRARPVAASGLLALLAAAAQTGPLAAKDSAGFACYWLLVAAVCAGLCCAGVIAGCLRGSLPRHSKMALLQLLPMAAAGAAVTAILVRPQAQAAHLLPGLWALLFGLGVFASRPWLPRAIGWVAAWYCAGGMLQLWLAEPSLPGPWGMGLTFGIGQLATAAVLHVGLERAASGGGDDGS
jgi:hypothetical protein